MSFNSGSLTISRYVLVASPNALHHISILLPNASTQAHIDGSFENKSSMADRDRVSLYISNQSTEIISEQSKQLEHLHYVEAKLGDMIIWMEFYSIMAVQ